jgi:hypothetical protein
MTMTNGQADSGHDLTEAEHETASADDYRRLHPDCVSCADETCIATGGCACGNDAGHTAPGQVGKTHPEYVHSGVCETVYVTEERMFDIAERVDGLAKQFERQTAELEAATTRALVADVTCAVYKLREYGVNITGAQANERARNIVAGILGGYRVSPLPAEPVSEEAFKSEGRIG